MYFVNAAFQEYKEKRESLVGEYMEVEAIGPQKEAELDKFLEQKISIGQEILSKDEVCEIVVYVNLQCQYLCYRILPSKSPLIKASIT